MAFIFGRHSSLPGGQLSLRLQRIKQKAQHFPAACAASASQWVHYTGTKQKLAVIIFTLFSSLYNRLFFLELIIVLIFFTHSVFHILLCLCTLYYPSSWTHSLIQFPASLAVWPGSWVPPKGMRAQVMCATSTWNTKKLPEYYLNSRLPSWTEKTRRSYNYIFFCYSINSACIELQ